MLAQKTNLPGATSKLAQIQQMPDYSETEEVAKILKQMLDDLSTRLKVLEDVDAKAQEEADKTYAKMVEWEQKLVKLANDKDKAKQKMMEEQLQRQKLAGVFTRSRKGKANKSDSQKWFEAEHSDPPRSYDDSGPVEFSITPC